MALVTFRRQVAVVDAWIGNWGGTVLSKGPGGFYQNTTLPAPDSTGEFSPPATFSGGWSLDRWIETLNERSASGRTSVFASQFQTHRAMDIDQYSGSWGSCVGVKLHLEDVAVLGTADSTERSTYRFVGLDTPELEVSEACGVIAQPRGYDYLLLRRPPGNAAGRTYLSNRFAWADVWIGNEGGIVYYDWNVTLPYPDATATIYDDTKAIDKRFIGGWSPDYWIFDLERRSAAGETCVFAAQYQSCRVVGTDGSAGVFGVCVGAKLRFVDRVVLGFSRSEPRNSFRFVPFNTNELEVSTMVGIIVPPRGIPTMLVRRPV